jgi:hypothetical protein
MGKKKRPVTENLIRAGVSCATVLSTSKTQAQLEAEIVPQHQSSVLCQRIPSKPTVADRLIFT